MYDKLGRLTDVKHLTDFVTPGQSFVITNEQARLVHQGKLKPQDTTLITDRD